MSIGFDDGAGEFHTTTAHAPHASALPELMQILTDLMSESSVPRERTLKWNRDPEEFDFRFVREGDKMLLQIYKYPTDDIFDKVGNKWILNTKEFENQRRLDPTAEYEISDFTFDVVIPLSSKSVIVIKDDKFDIFVHYNSVGLKGIWADEIVPIFNTLKEDNYLIQAHYAKFRIGEKWGLISSLGHVELQPEFYAIDQAPGIYYYVEYKPRHWGTMTLTKRYFKQ